VAVSTTLITSAADRSLLLALPALAALAAFALPTLQRSVAAWIDWFTLLFFSTCAVIIWLVWLAMQTGYPPQVSANVLRLAPGFVPSFSIWAMLFALAASLAWCWLVRWRVGRHRAALWKSLVLPAGGASLCWLLLMTLWLPLLDFARSYAPLVQRVSQQIAPSSCVAYYGLSQAQMAAFSFHGPLKLQAVQAQAQCPWLIVDADMAPSLGQHTQLSQWQWHSTWRRPSDNNEDVQLYRRRSSAP
jgi:4-amino-4-deoxy-L-arabinose transferase-like glycosyltransferase